MPRRLSTALVALAVTVPLGFAGSALAGDDKDRPGNGRDAAAQSDHGRQAPDGSGRGANSDCGAYCPTPDEGRQGNGNAPQNGTVGKADSKNPPGQRPDGSDRNRGYECDRNPGVGDGNPAHTGCAQETTPTTAAPKRAKPGKPSKPVKSGKPKAGKPGKPAEPAKPAEAAKPAKPGKPAKTTICHATGSATNPYVIITVSNAALAAHRVHQHGRDIIPAPAEGCPAPAGSAAALKDLDPLEPGILGQTGASPTTGAAGNGKAPAVLGAFAEGGPEPGAPGTDGRRESGGDAAAATGRLPFTGLGLGLVAALGLGAILAGLALQRSVGRRAA